MVPAYEDRLVWEGHSSMIVEVRDQLQKKPDAIFCSVGGGGLLGGIILGCKEVGWDDGEWRWKLVEKASQRYFSPNCDVGNHWI